MSIIRKIECASESVATTESRNLYMYGCVLKADSVGSALLIKFKDAEDYKGKADIHTLVANILQAVSGYEVEPTESDTNRML